MDTDDSLDLHEEQLETMERSYLQRPKGTQKVYNSKVREFREWCARQAFEDGDTVTPSKLHAFLKNEVVNRKSKVNSQRTITKSTVNLYVAAVVDLYQQQKSLGINRCTYSTSSILTYA
jgi:hypothetical protein